MGFLFTWLADTIIWPSVTFLLGHLKWLGGIMTAMGFRFWGVVFIGAGLAYEGFSLVGDLTIKGAQTMAGLLDGTFAGTANTVGSASPVGDLGYYLAICNTFYPLDETVRMCAAMITLWIAIFAFRLLKMAIPFFSAP